MLKIDGYFDPSERRREKEESRARDEYLIAQGILSENSVAQRNGFFSSLDPAKARIVKRHVRLPSRAGDARAA